MSAASARITPRLVFYLASLLLVVHAVRLVPMPYYVFVPNRATPVTEILETEGEVDEISGALLLTTVSSARASATRIVRAWLDPHEEVHPTQAVIPEGMEPDEYFDLQRAEFEEATTVAAVVGLELAGEEVELTGEGARIEAVLDGAPADGVLREGDVIIAIDGDPVQLATDVSQRASVLEDGQEIVLTVERGDDQLDLDVTPVFNAALGHPMIGIRVSTVDPGVEFPEGISIEETTDIGGASAGLMTALTVYDLYDPSDLTRERIIAGTGTISVDGTVGPIGAIGAKVVGAAGSGAEIFLAPASQADEARAAAPPGITVIGVASAEDAVAALAE